MKKAALADKERRLHEALQHYGRVAVGFSGGVDSTLLLRVARDVLGAAQVLAVIADTPSLPRVELAEAHALADVMGVTCAVVHSTELDDPRYAENSRDRCYHCKRHLFTQIVRSRLNAASMSCSTETMRMTRATTGPVGVRRKSWA